MRKILITAAIAAILAPTLLTAAPHDGKAFIKDYDTNKDGQVTRAEFDAVRTARFAVTDTNKDGWVSDAEYLAEYSVRLEQELAASTMTDAKKAEERVRQVRQTHVRFGALDTDKDGKMQKSEYDFSGNRAFTGWDHDKDGVVTLADVTAVAAAHAAAEKEKDAKPVD